PSRRRTRIAAAESPSWWSRKIVSSTSAFSIPAHSGFAFRNGPVDPLFPLRCAWRRAIVSSEGLAYRRDVYNVHGVQTANRGRKVYLARATTIMRKVFRVTGPNPFLTFVAAKDPSNSNLPRPSKSRTSGNHYVGHA